MKLLAQVFRAVMPFIVLGAALVAVSDTVYRAFTSIPGPVEWGTFLLSMPLAVVLVVSTAVPVSTILLLPVAALVGWRRGDRSARDALLAFDRWILGPVGSSKFWTLAWAVGLPVGSYLFALAILMIPAVAAIGNVLAVVLKLGISTLVFLAGIVAYRFIARRAPSVAAHPAAIYLVLAIWTLLMADIFWEFGSPFTLWLPMVVMVIFVAAASWAVVERADDPDRGRRRVGIAALVIGAATVVGLAAYPTESELHSEVMFRPLYPTGAWQLLVAASDLDGDGASGFLSTRDCASLDPEIRPFAMEIVGNGVDESCSGTDLAEYQPRPKPTKKPVTQRTNLPPVILVSIDTLRADYVGKTVGSSPVTPALDAFADLSVDFRRTYSVSTNTDESVPGFLSGMYPHDWHQFSIYFGVERTLPELLGQIGYRTIGVLGLPWLKVQLIHGLQIANNSVGDEIRTDERVNPDPEVTRLALEYLDQHDGDQPLFLWVHYYSPHAPYSVDPRLVGDLGTEPYTHDVHRVDAEFGRFINGLNERGLLKDAVIAVVSDHGEGLGEHNVATHTWNSWESIVRVPMMIRFPNTPARVVEAPVSTADLMPTLIDYLGVQNVVPREGRSLLPAVSGGELDERKVYVEAANHDGSPLSLAVVDGDWKLIHDLRRDAFFLSRPVEDPMETRNLMAEHPEVFERLRDELARWRDLGFNDVRLGRKRDLWEQRGTWEPETLILGGEGMQSAGATVGEK